MRYLDQGSPVNLGHPLNRGLVGWWLALPQAPGCSGWGSMYLRDLLGRYHGLRTNGPDWAGGGRPGGAGSLRFDGSDDEVGFGSPAVLNSLSAATFAFWVRVPSGQGAFSRVLEKGANDEVVFNLNENGAENLLFQWRTGGTIQKVTSGDGFNDGSWKHVVGVITGSGMTLYVNGASVGTDTASKSATGTGSLVLGRYGGGGFYGQFQLDDLRACSLALSADGAAALYAQSRRGHPDTLRWLVPRAWSFAPPPAVGGAPEGWQEWDSPALLLGRRENRQVIPR